MSNFITREAHDAVCDLLTNLDKATDKGTVELCGILEYMSRDERTLTVRETYIFHGILSSVAMLQSISFEDFARYARILGNYSTETIEEWWNHPSSLFADFVQ